MSTQKYLITVCALIAIVAVPASLVSAQDEATTTEQDNKVVFDGGIGPSSPFYFLDRAFESIGGILPRSASSQAKRSLRLAQERLGETQASVSESEAATRALEGYNQRLENAFDSASSSEESDVLAEVASSTTWHLSVLDRVAEQVPEEARDAVKQAKERSMQGQLSSLEALGRKAPKQAAEVSASAAENRLQAAEQRANQGAETDEDTQEVQKLVDEYEQYAEFGSRISSLAQGMEFGTTTPQDIVDAATQRHVQILQRIRDQVPPQARAGIQRAIQNSQRRPENRLPAGNATGTPAGQSGGQPAQNAAQSQVPSQSGASAGGQMSATGSESQSNSAPTSSPTAGNEDSDGSGVQGGNQGAGPDASGQP